MPLRVPCLLSRAAQSSGDATCWLSVPGAPGLTGLSVSDHIPSGYSWPARWLRWAGGRRWHGEGRGERGETGRDCRAGVWQELGALHRRVRGQQVPGAGQEVGTGIDADRVSGACPCVALCLCRACLSLKRWYVLFVSEEAKSSQRRKGFCQEQEDWANGRGNPAQERDEVADLVLLEKSWPSRVSGQFARQVTTSSFRALMTRQAPFQHGLDAEPRGEPRPSFRS